MVNQINLNIPSIHDSNILNDQPYDLLFHHQLLTNKNHFSSGFDPTGEARLKNDSHR